MSPPRRQLRLDRQRHRGEAAPSTRNIRKFMTYIFTSNAPEARARSSHARSSGIPLALP